MFHRRLLLLVMIIFLFAGVMLAQLFNLTVVQGAKFRTEAESALSSVTLVPTVRGRILDRKGRVLAIDEPTNDIALNYQVITGEWAYRQAKLAAYNADRTRWSTLGYDERERLIAEAQRPFDLQIESMWRTLCAIGEIDRQEMEQRKASIVERVQQIAASVSLRMHKERSTLFEDNQPFQMTDIEEQRATHSVLTGINDMAEVQIRRLMSASQSEPSLRVWGQVEVQPSKTRRYPLETLTVSLDRESMPSPLLRSEPLVLTVEGVATHLVGSLRSIWGSDLNSRPFKGRSEKVGEPSDLGGYLPGDRTGAWGIEKSMEQHLRGTRGQLTQRLDTREVDAITPLPGEDVTLTLDVALQARVQAIMDPRAGLMKVQEWNSKDFSDTPLRPQLGQSLNGAAVIIDISTSEVIAAVSMPSMSLRQLREDPRSILDDQVNRPYINRAVAQAFQPGSTVKPLVLATGVTDRKVGYSEAIDCQGHLLPNLTTAYRCWIFNDYNRTHGPLGGAEAIARSCNIYFYTAGGRLGAPRLVSWYQKFGLGNVSNCGLPEEVGGDLPELAADGTLKSTEDPTVIARMMGIGQGPIQWTPLQAAAAYAALARGGIYISPTFLVTADNPSRHSVSLNLDQHGVDMALDGLFQAVNTRIGTSHHLAMLDNEPIFNAPNITVYGKSGTADTAPLRIDSNGDNRITSQDKIVLVGTHAWLVVLVKGPNAARPQYAIAVVVEHGGKGAAVAGPVVNQIVHALDEEGYL